MSCCCCNRQTAPVDLSKFYKKSDLRNPGRSVLDWENIANAPELTGPQGPQGDPGPQGPQGPEGPPASIIDGGTAFTS